MVPINPWAWYQVNDPDKIPDLNPHDDDEARGCVGAMISFGLAVLIFVLIQWGLLELCLSKIISRDVFFLLILVNILVFAGLTILFMNIGFKIVDKINKKRRKMSKQRKHKTPIDIVLSRAHNLQVACFGTPISVTIEASQGTYDAKMLSVTIYSPFGEDKLYVISSSMNVKEMTQIWGSIKNAANKLLDELVGHRITKRGNLKQVTPLAP